MMSLRETGDRINRGVQFLPKPRRQLFRNFRILGSDLTDVFDDGGVKNQIPHLPQRPEAALNSAKVNPRTCPASSSRRRRSTSSSSTQYRGSSKLPKRNAASSARSGAERWEISSRMRRTSVMGNSYQHCGLIATGFSSHVSPLALPGLVSDKPAALPHALPS